MDNTLDMDKLLQSPDQLLSARDTSNDESVQMEMQIAEPAEVADIPEDPSFSFDGFQVVRGEYFAHLNEPSVTFSDHKFAVNNACLKKAVHTDYVQIMVNAETKKLVLRPCDEDQKDSYCWCTASRKPRIVTCHIFFLMIFDMMHWNPDHRYKLLGKMIKSQGEYLFVFDLQSPEIYQRQIVEGKNGKPKRTTKRSPTYQDSWKNQFGMPVREHKEAMQINIFDGYAVIEVNKKRPSEADRTQE